MVNKKEKIIGICKLCKETKDLSFEHFPPSSAYNKNTKYFSISHDEYFKNSDAKSLLEFKPKGRKFQGGLGDYCLCEDCNGFLGSAYVREYKKWASLGRSLINENDGNFKSCSFIASEINFLKILKQIIAIFICNNKPSFTHIYPDLIEFVRDEKSTDLPSRFRIYTYLNNEGQIRNGNICYTNLYGTVCDFTFRPFGYVLSIDNEVHFDNLLEISGLKDITDFNKTIIEMTLNKYPTHLPFVPMDYRSKEEINLSN